MVEGIEQIQGLQQVRLKWHGSCFQAQSLQERNGFWTHGGILFSTGGFPYLVSVGDVWGARSWLHSSKGIEKAWAGVFLLPCWRRNWPMEPFSSYFSFCLYLAMGCIALQLMLLRLFVGKRTIGSLLVVPSTLPGINRQCNSASGAWFSSIASVTSRSRDTPTYWSVKLSYAWLNWANDWSNFCSCSSMFMLSPQGHLEWPWRKHPCAPALLYLFWRGRSHCIFFHRHA